MSVLVLCHVSAWLVIQYTLIIDLMQMTGQNPGKTAAIILGGIAGVAFLVIFLLFARNLRKKHSGMSYML